MRRLADKVAIITGGSSGIGREIARRFSEEGARLVIADIRREDRKGAGTIDDEIVEKGGEAIFHQTDVTSLDDLDSAIDAAVSEFGKLDIMVNNAGVFKMEPITDITEAEFDKFMAINVKGVYFGAKKAAQQMLKQNSGGSIINLSSVAGIVGTPNATLYCATKGAITNFTRALAAELGRNNIRVNAICPGVIATAMTEIDEPVVGKFAAAVPMGRDGQPSEIAECAVFLASDESSFITGHNLVADGGYTAQ